MTSGLQHIDDFFRKKNESLSAETSSADLHWQQMQDALSKDLSLPAKKPRHAWMRPWMKYAAMVTIVAASLFIAITKPWKESNTKIKTTVSTVNTTPIEKKKPQPVTRLGGSAANSTIPVTNTTTHVAKLKPGNTARKMSPVINDEPASVSAPDSAAKTTITEQNNATAFGSFYNELKKRAEEFIIDAGKDTTIYCKEGTTLFIPASCFQSVSGLAVTGQVAVYVQEFYSIADIIGNKLTTSSNGRRLITGGMLNITATAANQEIMIKPGAAINLTMPTRVFDPTMQLFTPAVETVSIDNDPSAVGGVTRNVPKDQVAVVNDGINWIQAGQDQFSFNESKKDITILNLADNPYEIVSHNNKTIGKFRIPFNCKSTTGQIKEELEKRYGRFYDKIKVKREWAPLSRRVRKYREWGKDDWYESQFVGDSILIPLRFACRFKMITREDSLAYEAKWRKDYEDAKQRKQAYSEFLQVKDRYNFRISNLGWINCDRFSDYPPSRLADFTISTNDDFKETYFQAMLVLEKENSAIQGYWNAGAIHFSRLPVGDVVNVICVGAKNGKVFSAVQKFTVRKGESNNLEFKETTPEDFRNGLARFGSVTTTR